MRRILIFSATGIFLGTLLGLAYEQEYDTIWRTVGDTMFSWIPGILGFVFAYRNAKEKNIENIKKGIGFYLLTTVGFTIIFFLSGYKEFDFMIGLGFLIYSLILGIGIYCITFLAVNYSLTKFLEMRTNTKVRGDKS